jgi:putative phage-type endonuclease
MSNALKAEKPPGPTGPEAGQDPGPEPGPVAGGPQRRHRQLGRRCGGRSEPLQVPAGAVDGEDRADEQLPKWSIPMTTSSPMYWGTLLEPIVAAHYTRRTGNKVRRVNAVLQHPNIPWMLANLDREVIGTPEVQILECKTAGINGARLWRDGVPEYVQLQVMHQLAVTGKQAADVAVLIGGQDLQVFRIERDEALIAKLIAGAAVLGSCAAP